MLDARKNLAVSMVATPPSPATSGTSLVVASGEGSRFPTPPFDATVQAVGAIPTPANSEVVRVTGINTDTLTITRASSPRSIVTGDVIYASLTARALDEIDRSIPFIVTPSVSNTSGTFADVQVALDAAEAAGGGLVTVPNGTWSQTSTTALKIGQGVQLWAAPRATFIRNASSDNMLRNKIGAADGGYATSAGSIVIEGGIWDANGVNFPTQVCGIGIGHSQNVKIRNLTIKNMHTWHHIEINGSRHVEVRSVTLQDAINQTGREMLQLDLMKSVGEWPWEGAFDNTPCDDVLIDGCTFTNGNRAIGSHTSTTGKWHTNVRVIGNHFGTFSEEAIRMQDWSDVTIQGNTFEDCWKGIYAVGTQVSKGYLIQGNTMDNMKPADTLARGIHMDGTSNAVRYLRDMNIIGNKISNVGRYGMGSDYGVNVNFIANDVTSCVLTGIWAYQLTESNLIGNISNGNNPSANAGHSDINIGAGSAGATTTQDVNVLANQCGTMILFDCDRVQVEFNNIATSILQTGPNITNLQRSQNWVASTWDGVQDGGRRLAALTSRLTSAATSTSVTYATTGLSVTMKASGVYEFRARGIYRSAATTTGIGFRVNCSVTPTAIMYSTAIYGSATNASTPVRTVHVANQGANLTTAAVAATTDYFWEIEGTVVAAAGGGNLVIEFASEVAASTVTVGIGSLLRATEIA